MLARHKQRTFSDGAQPTPQMIGVVKSFFESYRVQDTLALFSNKQAVSNSLRSPRATMTSAAKDATAICWLPFRAFLPALMAAAASVSKREGAPLRFKRRSRLYQEVTRRQDGWRGPSQTIHRGQMHVPLADKSCAAIRTRFVSWFNGAEFVERDLWAARR